MADMSILILALTFARSLFKSQHQLMLENLALRQQVTMLRQSVKRPRATVADRMFWILISRYVDDWKKLLYALHPGTVVRWHRQGFRQYWRWKSRGPKPGRPAIDAALRKLIREIQATNIGWGAPRIHGELLKLGIEVSQATVSKYMLSQTRPPSQTWNVLSDLSAGLPGSRNCLRRAAFEADSSRLFLLLPLMPYSFIFEQRFSKTPIC